MQNFENLPANNPHLTGSRDNFLIIDDVKVAKHVALYRLKITDRGFEENSNRIFYSQQVHLTVIKQQPQDIADVRFDSSQELTFDAIGVQRTGGKTVTLTDGNDIKWERYDINEGKFVSWKKNGEVVMGTTVTVASSSPRFPKYRARLLTKNASEKVSRHAEMTFRRSYELPVIEIPTVVARIRYNKRNNGEYGLRSQSTGLRSTKTLDSSTPNDGDWERRWQRKLPAAEEGEEAIFTWIMKQDPEDEFFSSTVREVYLSEHNGEGRVEYKAFVKDRFGVNDFTRNIGVNNREKDAEVTIRLRPREEVSLISNITSHQRSDGALITDDSDLSVNVVWQRKVGENWRNMDNNEEPKVISMTQNSPDVRQFRVKFNNTAGVGGENIVTYHYFRVLKLVPADSEGEN